MMDADDLITAVKSPKGTTAAGMAILEKSALAKIVQSTLEAAAERSRELSA
jgi:pyrroline-5-carboxylate reductase